MLKFKLPRIHSFEFHDLDNFPNFLKYQITFILHIFWTFELPLFITNKVPILKKLFVPRYKVISKPLSDAIETVVSTFPDNEVVVMDMCSGGSGPNDLISKQVNFLMKERGKKSIKFYLSDLYPSIETWKRVCSTNPYLSYIENPVDATKPFTPTQSDKVFQTFYCCFHHFEDNSVRRVLKNSLECSDGFAIIETTNRTLFNCLKAIILNTLFIVLIAPFYLKKAHSSMLITIYIFPILLFTFIWDNLISCLRSRSNEELIEIIKEFDLDTWFIESGYGYSTYCVDKVNWVICTKTKN